MVSSITEGPTPIFDVGCTSTLLESKPYVSSTPIPGSSSSKRNIMYVFLLLKFGERGNLHSKLLVDLYPCRACGGCAASVKRILESQPQVFPASVNLTTETAIVWPVSEAKITPSWQKDLGEALANHLTNCGFTSNLRDWR